MSIAATNRIAAADYGMAPAGVVLVLTVFSVATAVAARVLPPRYVNGPLRIPSNRPAWPLAAVLFGGLSVYLLSASLIISLARGSATTQPAAMPGGESKALTAVVSTIPPLLGLIALLLGDAAVADISGHDLGMGVRRLPHGLAAGLLGLVIVVPPLMLLSIGVEALYRIVHYTHEAEHPLLKVLGERPPAWVTALIVLGATVIAPLFEELVFRGHIQTLLKRLLWRLTNVAAPPSSLPSPTTGFPVGAAEPVGPAPSARPESSRTPHAWQSWAAIILTSALFAVPHPGWTRPIIFGLALGLGYAYERTGNLWTSITMHALFNSIQTALFLAGLEGH